MGGCEAPSVLDDVRFLCMLNSVAWNQYVDKYSIRVRLYGIPYVKAQRFGSQAVAFRLFLAVLSMVFSRADQFQSAWEWTDHPMYITDPQVHQPKTRHQKPGQSGMHFVTLAQGSSGKRARARFVALHGSEAYGSLVPAVEALTNKLKVNELPSQGSPSYGPVQSPPAPMVPTPSGLDMPGPAMFAPMPESGTFASFDPLQQNDPWQNAQKSFFSRKESFC